MKRSLLREQVCPRRGLCARPVWLALLPVFAALADAPAQPAATNDPRDELIRQLLHRVSGLEAEVKELKGRPATATPDTNVARPAGAEPPVEALAAEAAAPRRFPDLQFRGFGDVMYHVSDRRGENHAFSLGQLDLFITSQLWDNVSVLSEIVFKAGNDNKFGVEVERLLLQYYPSDYFNLAVGRYHTAVGYYNSAYHHGSWFQTAVNRPFLFAFNGLLPLHNTGASLTGLVPSGRLGLHYLLEVGNGRAYSKTAGHEPDLSITDDNDYKAVNVGLFARPDCWPGFQAGVSVYHDWLTPAGLPRVDQTILNVHAVYLRPPWEILNEVALFRHDPRGAAPPCWTTAFYTQVARQVGPVRPYVRYQYQDAPASDVIFSNFGAVGYYHGAAAGLRYDFSRYAAFKLQYDRTWQQSKSTVNELTLQVAFTF